GPSTYHARVRYPSPRLPAALHAASTWSNIPAAIPSVNVGCADPVFRGSAAGRDLPTCASTTLPRLIHGLRMPCGDRTTPVARAAPNQYRQTSPNLQPILAQVLK